MPTPPPNLSSPPTPPQRTDSANFRARADSFLTWLGGTLVQELRDALLWISDALGQVLSARDAAAVNAANAGLSGVTSTTGVTLGTGSKVFTVNNVRAYAPSMPVRVVNSAQVYMQGTISAVVGNDITVNVTQATGVAGAYSAWAFAPEVSDPSVVRLTGVQTVSDKTLVGLREVSVALGSGSAIDLAAGNGFSKTITQATIFTLSNVAASGTLNSFLLDLTNGGAFTVTWWSGIKWQAGAAPVLTASGRDVLGFFSVDGGTTWTGFASRDVR